MPILLIFALIASCLPIEWPLPPYAPMREVAASLTMGAVLLVLLLAFALRTWVVRTLNHDPSRRYEVARIYNKWRRFLFFINLSAAAACVLAFGWGWLMRHELLVIWNNHLQLAPFAELAVPLPYFVILLGCWLIYYDAERALYRILHLGDRVYWSRFAYLLHNLRQFALMVLLPVMLIVAQQTLARYAPETTRSDIYRIASLGVVPLLLLFMPLLIKPLLGLQTMPTGPIRDRLESLAKRLHFRCTDFLLWPTHGAAANALIAGLLPRVRYVIFTDRILEELPPDELDAVLGHEIGHAKHGHIWLYALFLMLSLMVLAALFLFVGQKLDDAGVTVAREYATWWFYLPPVIVLACYLFVVFGALSRRCERQADVFGCKAVSCADPACSGHNEETFYPPGGHTLCPTGIRTFSRALARVGEINGIVHEAENRRSLGRLLRTAWEWVRAWQHSPMSRRVAFLMELIERPAIERRFQWYLFAFKWALMLALVAALVLLGNAVGWAELYETM